MFSAQIIFGECVVFYRFFFLFGPSKLISTKKTVGRFSSRFKIRTSVMRFYRTKTRTIRTIYNCIMALKLFQFLQKENVDTSVLPLVICVTKKNHPSYSSANGLDGCFFFYSSSLDMIRFFGSWR